jgi:hypothetical protein
VILDAIPVAGAHAYKHLKATSIDAKVLRNWKISDSYLSKIRKYYGSELEVGKSSKAGYILIILIDSY